MSDPNRSIVIGVDAGGTQTEAWVVDENAINASSSIEPLGRGKSGPGNLRAVGFSAASGAIEDAIRQALEDASLPSLSDAECLDAKLCVSAAGAGRDAERSQLTEWAKDRFATARLRVTDDARPILAAATTQQVGIALISGTGSFAWGRNHEGVTHRCGGWGYLFGDEGSGYAVGVAALRAAAQCADGRGQATVLLRALCEHFQISQPSQLIQQIYAGPIERRDIAGLSELVFDATTDRVAQAIIESAADSLADLVNTLAERLGFDEAKIDCPTTLAIGGGLLIHQSALRDRLSDRIAARFQNIQLVPHPVAGAVRLAAEL